MSLETGPIDLAVFVTSWGETSETFVRREAEAAAASGNAVHVISLRKPKSAAAGGITVHHLVPWQAVLLSLAALIAHPLRGGSALARVALTSSRRNMGRHLAAMMVGIASSRVIPGRQVAHAHFAWLAATMADGYAEVTGVPLSVFPHAFDVFEPDKLDGYLRSKLRRAALVAVESETMARDLAARFGCRPTVVRIGVPEAWVVPPADRKPTSAPLVVSIGMLREKKGHDVLIRAVSEIPEARLDIIGEGPERASLEQLMHALGVSDRVRLVGALEPDDVRRRLDTAQVFALASRTSSSGDRDGVPNVLIEAMARGLPAISTDLSGIPDLLGDGRGVVVPSNSHEQLRDAIRDLIADPVLADSVARTGNAHIREHYVVESNWRLLETQLRQRIRGTRS